MKTFFQSLLIFVPFCLFNSHLFAEEKVAFRASDGTELEGLLFGEGETALVFCHGQSLFNSHREEVFSQILSFIKE